MGIFRSKIPNALSISRIPASALFVVLYSHENIDLYYLSVAIVLFAIITDVLDGYLARKWNVTSLTGYFLDGIGDKCFTVAISLVIVREYSELSLLVWMMICREIILYALRVVDKNPKKNLSRLRVYSLLQATFIRLFFFVFFVDGYFSIMGSKLPYTLPFYLTFGSIAVVCGYISVYFLAQDIAKE